MKAVPVSLVSLYLFLALSPKCFSQKSNVAANASQQATVDSTFLVAGNNSSITRLSKKEIRKNKKNPYSPNDTTASYSYRFRNEDAPLKFKLLRGEKMIGGSELLGMGILILLPKKVTKWQEDWMADAMRNLKRSWTNMPVWDKDNWKFNYVGHPVAGSYYYNAVRSQNASMLSSFAFSAFQSTLWEYVVEGIAERPSIQDLFVTPIGGAVLGEVTHRVTLKMQRNGFNFFEKAFVLVLNPMYAINNGFKKKYKRIPLYN